MGQWQNRFDKEIAETMQTIFSRAKEVLQPGFVILSVSYQLFVEGVGEYRYRLDIAKIGDGGTEDYPEIVEVMSACFDVLPDDGVIEEWVKEIQESL